MVSLFLPSIHFFPSVAFSPFDMHVLWWKLLLLVMHTMASMFLQSVVVRCLLLVWKLIPTLTIGDVIAAAPAGAPGAPPATVEVLVAASGAAPGKFHLNEASERINRCILRGCFVSLQFCTQLSVDEMALICSFQNWFLVVCVFLRVCRPICEDFCCWIS